MHATEPEHAHTDRDCFRTAGQIGSFPGLCNEDLLAQEPGPGAGEVAIHPGNPSTPNQLLDVRWTNTGETPAHVDVVWTFHKLTCDSTVNFAVYVDGSAQEVQYKDTPFSDQSAVEFSFEALVSSGGTIDWVFGSGGDWSCAYSYRKSFN
jgi:hypothetical protein